MKPTPLAKVDAICLACGEGHGFDIVKLPGGGPWGARCKGCGSLNDPVGLGYHLDEIVDVGPYEERYVAKSGKAKSALELLAERVKGGTQPRKVSRGPTYTFPEQRLAATMKQLDLKVAAVALEAGVDDHYVTEATKGRNIRVAQALKLAKAAGMSVEELFGPPAVVTPKGVSLNETPTGAEAVAIPFDGEPITNGGAEEAV